MPLLGSRPGKGDTGELISRRCTLDPANIFRRDHASHAYSVESLTVTRGIQSSDGTRRAGDPPRSPAPGRSNAQTPRFHLLKSRHASDSQLSQKAKEHARKAAVCDTPPLPASAAGSAGERSKLHHHQQQQHQQQQQQTASHNLGAPAPTAPAIITTAPTMEPPPARPPPQPKKKTKFPAFRRRLSSEPAHDSSAPKPSQELPNTATPSHEDPARLSVSRAREVHVDGARSPAVLAHNNAHAEALSDSSRSDASSNDHIQLPPQKRPLLPTLVKWHTDSHRKSLFPLPPRSPATLPFPETAPATPRASISRLSMNSAHHLTDGACSPPATAGQQPTGAGSSQPSRLSSHSALAAVVMAPQAAQPDLFRNDSTTSARSIRSWSSQAPAPKQSLRHRTCTFGSTRTKSDDGSPPTPPLIQDGRLSTSTTGRSSFSNLFHLGNRFRQGADPNLSRRGSPGYIASGIMSHSSSLNASREALVIPEREDGEAPGRYLERLEENMNRSLIASIVARRGDEFSLTVLRSYMRRFMFFGDPIDMAIRKLLMEVELPKETQQIDRVLQGFADRYHECNPGIFISPEEAYFISFSIVLLNSDFFNPNNKRKMQKPDYIKNCNGGGSASEVHEDVLATIYDNIIYTQFIHIDDEVDLCSLANRRGKKTKAVKNAVQDPIKRAQKEPVDPYTLIFENRLDILRPPIKDVMQFEDPYSYKGTSQAIDLKLLNAAFAKYGVVQIHSARSRPDAFMSPSTIENPEGAQAGVVEMPVTKVGILWRKDSKRKTARSPWQEWGAVLTRSSLSFFKNAGWAKSLVHQHDSHDRPSDGRSPPVFRPPVEDFKPDYALPMDQCVAVTDSSYKKHKYAFVIFAKGRAEEVFLANDEADMNDWLAKLNYTAAFETAGIRPRGLIGGSYDGQRNRAIRRLDYSQSAKSIQGPTGEVVVSSGRIDNQLAQQIAKARRENIQRKVEETEDRLGAAVKQLDSRLRDSRHLQVMAPIQPRTREYVMHAAGRMAARLKWIRIEIVRMKAHRDILIMDVDEDKRHASEARLSVWPLESATALSVASSPSKSQGPRSSRLSGLSRIGSKASGSSTRPRSPKPPSRSGRPDTTESEHENDGDVFTTPPESSQPSPASPPADWALPTADPRPSNRDSWTRSAHSSRPELALSLPPSTRGDVAESVDGSDSASRLGSESASDIGRTASHLAMNLDGQPSTPAADATDRPAPDSPESHHRIRRGLHRTLRDGRSGSSDHRRGGKGKESNSSVVSDDPGAPPNPDVLPRTHQNFTVHGKKASVVTFGAEWQNLSAEDRLRLRRLASDDDTTVRGRGRAVSATSESQRAIQDLPHGPGPTLECQGKESMSDPEPQSKEILWGNGMFVQNMADSALACDPIDMSPMRIPSADSRAESPGALSAAQKNAVVANGEDDEEHRVGSLRGSHQHPQAVHA